MNLIKNIYYLIIPLLIVGVSFRFTSFPIALLAIIALLLTSSRHTVGIFLLMYGGPFGGVVRAMYPFLPVYGVLLEFIGFLLIWDTVMEMIKKHMRVVVCMLLILAFFGLFYLIGPRDDNANRKYMSMCLHGFLMLFGYYCFDRSKKVNAENLSRILIVASICLFTHVISRISMSPGDFFDFNWFRDQYMANMRMNQWESDAVVDYQQVGMLVLFAVVIYLSQVKLSVWKSVFYVLCVAELTLVSGCRQAIIGVLVAIILRLVFFRKENLHKNNNVGFVALLMTITLLILYVATSFIFSNIGSDVMARTLEEGDMGRRLLWMKAFAVFLDHPFSGVGIGGYYAITGDFYPHNFILELLAETGIVGVVMTIAILFIPFYRRQGVYIITQSNMFYFFLVTGIFVRVMVSSDLREGIELFSAIVAVIGMNKMHFSKKSALNTVKVNNKNNGKNQVNLCNN